MNMERGNSVLMTTDVFFMSWTVKVVDFAIHMIGHSRGLLGTTCRPPVQGLRKDRDKDHAERKAE